MIGLQDFKLRNKLGLVLTMPILCLILFSAYLLNNEIRKQTLLNNLNAAEQFVSKMTSLIHELQYERSLSIAFSESNGEAFKDELLKQQQVSNKLWGEFIFVIENQDNKLQLTNLEEINRQYAALKLLQKKVELQEMNTTQILNNYIEHIMNLFNALETITIFVSDADLSRYMKGYLSLSHATELAAQERARGGLIFSSSSSLKAHSILVSNLISSQKILLKLSLQLAPEQIQQVLIKPNNTVCVKQVQQSVHKSKKNAMQKKYLHIFQWLKISSCRINQLHETGQLYLNNIIDQTNNKIESARQQFYLILILALLPQLLSLVLIYWVDRNINTSLSWLLRAMREIADGNFNTSLPPRSRDEFGMLSNGLNMLRLQLSKHETNMKNLLFEQQQQNQELSQKTAKLQQFAAKIAKGELHQQLSQENSTANQLSNSLNQMFDGLSAFRLQIGNSSKTIKNMVLELNRSVNEQSTGASQQAASVNETVVTLEQLRSSSSQTLQKARTLGDIAEKARHEGDNGRKAIEQSIEDMKIVQNKMDAIAHNILTLNEWIQRIGDITSSVHDIARQLRLISLNASIEANNAGDAGKGFAVVASEVKQLAERSQQSTIHVQTLLEEIHHATDRTVMATEEGSKGVELGLKQIQRTGEVIQNLESAVGETSIASKQIVVAVNLEVSSIEQINYAIKEIYRVTDQFTHTANQSRNAAHNLSNLVKHLDDTITEYQL
ncbi:MAG: HAMP domain-containing protein [Gammaproteobacteria bacterium]|nr:HAMP domain-containing protein [Gammaproteobacteria bacterium]